MEKSSSLLDNPNAPTIPHWWRVEEEIDLAGVFIMTVFYGTCQGHSSLDAPSELNPLQRIPSPLFIAPLVPQAEG